MPLEPILLPLLLPPFALFVACYLLARRMKTLNISLSGFLVRIVSTLISAAVAGFFIGYFVGAGIACGLTGAGGNQCGFAGGFVAPPTGSAVGVMLSALYLIKRIKSAAEE